MNIEQDMIAIYSRKSRFTGKGESIGNQVELCRGYIRAAFGEEYAEAAAVFEDEGFSGGDLNRPAFRRMMCAVRQRRFRAVVVYRLDRISRNIGDFSALIQELGRLDTGFISIREQFDTASPMGRAMMYIASVFSQLERETIAERIRDNMHELAKTGRWLGGVTPTGYTWEAVKGVTAEGRQKRACKLKLIPGEAGVVREIFRLYEQTGSLTATEAELLRRHILTKNGRRFTRFSIKGILQNPVYLIADREAWQYFADRQAELCAPPQSFDGVRGVLAYHRTDQKKGRSTVYLPPSRWIVSVGEHPGIIPAATWIRVQEALERNGSKAYGAPRSNRALLTGLLWCSCGSRMYPKLTGRQGADGVPIHTYVCKEKERSRGGLCSGRNVRGDLLDEAVMERIAELEEDGAAFCAGMERERRHCTDIREEREEELEELRRQRAEAGRRIAALVDALAGLDGSAAAVQVKARIEELHARDAGLRERVEALERCAAGRELSGDGAERLCRQLASFRSCVEGMTVEEKRSALGVLVDRVIWDGQCAHVVLAGARYEEAAREAERGAEEKSPCCEDSK